MRRNHDRTDARVGEVRRHAPCRRHHRDDRSGDDAGADWRRAQGDGAASVRAPDRSEQLTRRHRRSAGADLRLAAPGQRRRLPSLQAADDPAPAVAAHGAASHQRRQPVPEAAARRSGGAARSVPGPADSRDTFLPRARVVRGAERAGVPQADREARAGASDPRVGVRLRDRRGSLLARHRADRFSAAPAFGGPRADLRHRRQRDGDRARPRGRLPGEHRRRHRSRLPAALLQPHRRPLPRQQTDPRHGGVRAPGSHQGSAVFAARPGDVPQRVDLHGHGAAAEADRDVPLRADPERVPGAWPGGVGRRAGQPVRVDGQEAPDSPQEDAAGCTEPDAALDRRLPGIALAAPASFRARAGHRHGLARRGEPPDPGSLRAARRGGRRRFAHRPVPWPDRPVPRARGRRRQPQPDEDAARRPALRGAQRDRCGAQVAAKRATR